MALTTQELSDREEIRETIMRWSRGVDTRDWGLLQSAYTEDLNADFSVLGIPKGSAAELLAFLQKSGEFFQVFHHVLSNLTFHEVAGNTARTTTMYFAIVIPKQAPLFHDGGWYHDVLRRTTNGWRICERRAQRAFNTIQGEFTPPALK